MPSDRGARCVLRHECVLKRIRSHGCESCRRRSEREKKLGDGIHLLQLAIAIIVLPSERDYAPLSRVAVELELAKRQLAESRE
jgi:hypothetical protein